MENSEFWGFFLDEDNEFEQRINIGSRFHSNRAATPNARELMTVLNRGSTKGPINEDRKLRGGMYEETGGWYTYVGRSARCEGFIDKTGPFKSYSEFERKLMQLTEQS